MGLKTEIAEIIRYADSKENPILIPEYLKEDYIRASKQILAKIGGVVGGAGLTDDELYQCSLLSEDDCKEIEELHKSYGDDIFYGEDDFARHRFAGDIVVRRKITQAHTKAILKAIEED